ncbi:hypothetical protein [Duganella violaceipulchra]|uniref:NADP-dependent oxidoreductase domain-containing protein n=1 Tax=Duganella violaceipulchra TaxID=2849652 RepID=A0ABT1GFP4_9BURK|nr:hypothetical protein [Duganella violaceicalia]MCP2007787.1 hypothetical protein [Duganella violaceicalia]
MPSLPSLLDARFDFIEIHKFHRLDDTHLMPVMDAMRPGFAA